ncbi:putative protein PYRICULARIA ORYZAE RESISTANCE 21 [Dioscorea sansibarensis]
MCEREREKCPSSILNSSPFPLDHLSSPSLGSHHPLLFHNKDQDQEEQMSGKFATLILKVDLSCCECNRKIKKLLCKIQDRENIRSIAYDDKNNTVTISGPFDPHYLKRKLYCKACKIIKDIQIPPPPPPPEKKPDKAPEKKPDPPPEKKPDPPPEKKPDPPPEKKPDPPPEKKPDPPPQKKPDPPPEKKPDPPPEKKPDPPPEKKPDPPPEKKPDPPPEKKPDPPPEKKPDPPPEKKPQPPKCEWPPGPVCCTRPCYVGMFGGLKCASCGMVYTWTNQCPPPVMVCNQPPVPRPYCYDGYGYGCGCGCGQPKTCQFICEDNTSQCAIM